jgi:Protein of unknown function (DUF2510)
MSAVAGWYQDPEMPGRLRWWDGGQWTDHLTSSPPVPAMAGAPFQAAQARLPVQAAFAYQDAGGVGLIPRPASSEVAEFAGLPCQACGAGPSAELKLNRLRGLLLLFVVTTWKGRWCRDCAVGPFREAQNFTLAWGWWGWLTIFLTPVALLMNLRQLHVGQRLPRPVGRRARVLSPGMPLNQRPGLWISATLLLVIVILIITRG